jgi:hypothetical protein
MMIPTKMAQISIEIARRVFMVPLAVTRYHSCRQQKSGEKPFTTHIDTATTFGVLSAPLTARTLETVQGKLL